MNAAQPSTERNPKSGLLQTALVLSFFAALAVFPVFYYGYQSEIPKWIAASAMENFDDEQTELAVQQMTAAHQRAENDFEISMNLVQILVESGRPSEALQLCNQALAGDELTDGQRQVVIMQKAHSLQYQGEFQQALNVYNSQDFPATNNSTVKIGRMNNLAYFRALANDELPRAERDIGRAIDLVEEIHYSLNSKIFLKIEARTLMAVAIVSRYTNQQSETLTTLSDAIRKLEDDEFESRQKVTEVIDAVFTPGQSENQKIGEQSGKSVRSEFQKVRQSLAMLLTVRALLHQDLNQPTQSGRDRLQIIELGYDPDKLVKQLPDGAEADNLLSQAMTYLDTRGFVRLRRSKLVVASTDLDLAILASETSLDAMTSPISNSPYYYNGTVDLRAYARQIKRTCAVLHAHRIELGLAQQVRLKEKMVLAEQDENVDEKALAVHRQKNTLVSQRIKADRKRLIELGFDPDEPLF